MPKKLSKEQEIFIAYDRWENRLPSRDEFNREYYGRILKEEESDLYYSVKESFLKEEF